MAKQIEQAHNGGNITGGAEAATHDVGRNSRLRRELIRTVKLSPDVALAGLTGATLFDQMTKPLVLPEPVAEPEAETETGHKLGAPVTLGMFNGEATICNSPFVSHYFKNGSRNEHLLWLRHVGNPEAHKKNEARRRRNELRRHPDKDIQEYDRTRPTKVRLRTLQARQAVNKAVYDTLIRDYDLSSDDEARDFFRRQMERANEAVVRHGELIYPHGATYYSRNELASLSTPADFVEYYLRRKIDPRTRFEIGRNLLLAQIAGEIEGMSRGAGESLAAMQRLLNDKFFAGDTGRTNPDVKYGIFDTRTNELLYEDIPATDGSDKVKKRPLIYDATPSELPENAVVKPIQMETRTVASTGDEVIVILDIKSVANAVRKGIRKAMKEGPKRGNDDIRPDLDIRDTHRMTIIVLGDEDAAERVKMDVFDLIADPGNMDYFSRYTGAPDENPLVGILKDVEEADESKPDEKGKKPSFKRKRIFATFHGQWAPLEIFVQTLDQFVNATGDVGEYDPQIGEFTGQAHSLLVHARERQLNGPLFKSGLYPHLPDPAEHDNAEPYPPMAAEAQSLCETDVVVLVPKPIYN